MNDATLLGEIRAAYQAHRLVPVRQTFFFEAGGVAHACPLVALAIHRGAVGRDNPDLALDGAAGEFGDGWAWGFLNGFDGKGKALAGRDYLRGYGQGARVAQALLS
jgi:hypothetical protein